MPAAEPGGIERREARLAYRMVAPAVVTILLVALFPLTWTIWESFHLHDLRMPWLGRPFVGLENYAEVLGDRRFWGAMGHTLWFAAASVSLELVLGCILALAMNRTFRGRAVVTHQISDTNCIEGRTWGQRNGRIWVNHGCRARFGIVRNDVARRNDNRRYDNRRNDDLTDRTVVCASNRGAYRECRTGFRGDVYLSRRLNNSSACVEGRTWGQRPGSVWVRGGCRAQFESIGRRGPRDDNRAMGSLFTRDPGYFVTCSSIDGGRSVCNWDNRYGTPRMIERLSRDGCVEGRDWGYNSRGQVWVDSGCRARFGYR